MKKLILSAALATLVASPALAQSYTGSLGTGNIVPPGNYQASRTDVGTTGFARGAYAYEPARGAFAYEAAPGAVYDHGEYRGADPDPNVRLELRRHDPANFAN